MPKTSAYNELTTPASDDEVLIRDVSDTTMAATGTTKRISYNNLNAGVINVASYGATGDGVTDDTAAIQAAWSAATYGSVVEFSPEKIYAISDTLEFTGKTFVSIRGNGARIRTLTGSDFTGKAMIDLAGCPLGRMDNLIIDSTLTTNSPAVGLLLGRKTGNASGTQKFINVISTGYFSFAAHYNVGSEVCSFFGCTFSNYKDGGHAAYIASDDVQSLLDLSSGQLTGYYFGCIFRCFGTGGNNIYLKGVVSNYTFSGCYGVIAKETGHFVHAESGVGGSEVKNCIFENIRIEYSAADNSDCRFFYLAAGMTFDRSTIRNIAWALNSGVAANDPDYIHEFHGTVSNSFVFSTPNTYNKKLMLIKSTATILNLRVWCDAATSGEKQVTVESGATIYRSKFYWPDLHYPFDATPAGMNLVQWVDNKLGYANVVTFADGDATPTVGGSTFFTTGNTNPTTITDFDDGADGQEIFVRIGDTKTTIDFSATNLYGNDGVDYVAAYVDLLRCVKVGLRWYCDIIKA